MRSDSRPGGDCGLARSLLLLVAGGLLFAVVVVPSMTSASSVSVPHRFVNGAIADAGEVNENFNRLRLGVNDNDRRVRELETQVASLQGLVETLEARVIELEDAFPTEEERAVLEPLSLVTVGDGFGNRIPTLRISGVNVQIVNGDGVTASTNGAGNLIVGYQEGRESGNERTGSHNLVVGQGHSHSSYGGFVAGLDNTVSGSYAVVSGGQGNRASGDSSTVSGGCGRQALGDCDWHAGQLFQEE